MNRLRIVLLTLGLLSLTLAADAPPAMTEQTFDLTPLAKAHRGREQRPAIKKPTEKLDHVSETPEMFVEGFPRLVMELIEPGSWKDSGGRGEIKLNKTKLQVKQTKEVHAKIAALLEKMKSPRNVAKAAPAAGGKAEESGVVIAVFQIADLPAAAADSGALTYPIDVTQWMERLMNRVKATAGKENWRDSGGKEGTLLSTGTLLIVQHEPQHVAAIEDALRKWAAGK